MPKKKLKKSVINDVPPFLEVQYEDPLFTFACHPTEPLILSGLATGHVFLQKYDPTQLAEQYEKVLEERAQLEGKKKKVIWSTEKAQDPANYLVTSWKTKRHKQSCRIALMEGQGDLVYTIGNDNVIKQAYTETGKVSMKRDVSEDFPQTTISCAVLSNNRPHLLCGDELGNIRVFDTRSKLKSVFSLDGVHDDMVNQIVNIPNSSLVYHYISVGSTTLAKIDLRKGVLFQSENQEDEVVSVCFPDPNSNLSALCGMGSGVVTQWRELKNEYNDQISRIKVSKDNSIDCIMSTMDDDEPNTCWAGCSDGHLYKIDGKSCSVVEHRIHDDVDEVTNLDIDCCYRLVSAGMSSLKIWGDKIDNDQDESDDDDDETNDKSDSSDWRDLSGSESDEDSETEETTQEPKDEEPKAEEPKAEEPKAKETKDLETNAPEKKRKQDEKPVLSKKQKKAQKQFLKSVNEHSNGIAKFDDL